MVLPTELIDHIFSYLQDDPRALKACSKAHPLCSKLAKRHFYSHIVSDTELSNHILNDPRLLNYPRTLQIRAYVPYFRNPLPIMSVIPRMSNLVSLNICDPVHSSQNDEFLLLFRNCLQQSSFHQLSLSYVQFSPFSVLDDAKNIKHLTLKQCTVEDLPNSSSPSQVSLDTLILSGGRNSSVDLWAMRWVTRLTTLKLHYLSLMPDHWTAFPGLLAACSNSLTTFDLDLNNYRYNLFDLPFTLSPLNHLKRISISAMITTYVWALPEIIRIVNTAPNIQDGVALRFHCVTDSITSLARLDWSLLNHLQSDLTGKRPHVDLCITGFCITDETWGTKGPTFSSESIRDTLAANEALMDLVNRGLVILRSEPFL